MAKATNTPPGGGGGGDGSINIEGILVVFSVATLGAGVAHTGADQQSWWWWPRAIVTVEGMQVTTTLIINI